MFLLAADENLNNNLLRALLRKRPTLNIMRLQDAGCRMQDAGCRMQVWEELTIPPFSNGQPRRGEFCSPMM